jgi:hypothetical protein
MYVARLPVGSIDSLVPTKLICYHYRLNRPSRSFPRLDSRAGLLTFELAEKSATGKVESRPFLS